NVANCSLPCRSAMSGVPRERFSSTRMNRCNKSSGSSFAPFCALGTLGGLVRYLAHHQIQLGVRVREGPGKGELLWRRPNRATLQTMLKHPLYAGSYVYGRRQEDPRRKQPQRPRTGRVVMTTDEWLVLLPNRAARPTFPLSNMSATRHDCRPTALAPMPWGQYAAGWPS